MKSTSRSQYTLRAPRALWVCGLLILAGITLAHPAANASVRAAPKNVLDDFNRPGPELGSNWSKTTSTLVNNQLMGVAGGGPEAWFFWKTGFSADQWVSVKLVQLTGCNRLALLLKATGDTHTNGMVRVDYHSCATPKLIVYSYNPELKNWTPFKNAVGNLNAGDIFSAQVQSNSVVKVFINGALVLSDVLPKENAGFAVGQAGQIGLSLSSDAVIVDDFEGGNLGSSTLVPTTIPAKTATPSPYDKFICIPLITRPQTSAH